VPRLYSYYANAGKKSLDYPYGRTKSNDTVRDSHAKDANSAPINRITVTANEDQRGVTGKLTSQ